MWVQPRLKVDPPSGAGLTGTVGIPWSSSNNVVVATEGTSIYHYALTSGLLPAGLSLGALTGAITGTVTDPSGEVLLEEQAPAGEWGVVAGSFVAWSCRPGARPSRLTGRSRTIRRCRC